MLQKVKNVAFAKYVCLVSLTWREGIPNENFWFLWATAKNMCPLSKCERECIKILQKLCKFIKILENKFIYLNIVFIFL